MNFFYSFNQTGGKISEFWSGDYYDHSVDFIRTDILFECLEEKQAKKVIVPSASYFEYNLIVENLASIREDLVFYNLEKNKMFITDKIDILTNNTFYVTHIGIENILEDYSVKKVCLDLENFEVYQFEEK